MLTSRLIVSEFESSKDGGGDRLHGGPVSQEVELERLLRGWKFQRIKP